MDIIERNNRWSGFNPKITAYQVASLFGTHRIAPGRKPSPAKQPMDFGEYVTPLSLMS